LLPSAPAKRRCAGFTLIEVLVALSVVAFLFASIASLVITTARGARSIEQHLTTLETARAVIAALPDRDQLVPGTSAGEVADYPWRLDVSRFTAPHLVAPPETPWVPQVIVVTVRSPSGASTQIETVRLHRRPGG